MPIQFRCHNCRQVLSIASKKAGLEVTCPACHEKTRVPSQAEAERARDEAREVVGTPASAAVPPAMSPAAPGAHLPGQHLTLGAQQAWTPEKERNPWLDEEADEEEGFRIKRRQADESRPDMTPMADVVFLLLTFFMLTASFTMQKSLETEPPEPDADAASTSATVAEQEEGSIVVGINDKDELTVDDAPVASLTLLADALRAKFAQTGGEMEMTIEADPRCSFGIMVGVMDTGISIGMQKIRRVSLPVNE